MLWRRQLKCDAWQAWGCNANKSAEPNRKSLPRITRCAERTVQPTISGPPQLGRERSIVTAASALRPRYMPDQRRPGSHNPVQSQDDAVGFTQSTPKL